MRDKNGTEIKLGDMLQFKLDRYSCALGVVTSFSGVSENGVFVSMCGGGGMGNICVSATKSEVIDTLMKS